MTPEEQAQHDAEVERQLRELASEMAQLAKLPFEPTTIRKAIVAAVADAETPPTVSLNISGDDTVLVAQVRTLNNYTPLVGQTVLLAKQGAEIFILGSIASVNPRSAQASSTPDNGWIKASLSNGTHGGNDNDVYYRRIMDHGSWKMQWRGVWNPAGNDFMIDAGGALDPDYRPASYKAIACAREANDATTLRMDFAADGTVRWYQSAPTISSTSMGGSTSSNGGFELGTHNHGISDTYGANGEFVQSDATGYSGYHSVGSHSHSITTNSHSHGGVTHIADPGWISLNGVEYFL